MTGSLTKDAFADAEFVIEAVFEEMAAKQQVLAEDEAKVSAECVQSSSQYVHADVTAGVPWVVHALFSAGARREPARLHDRLPEALARLDADLAPRRAALRAELDEPVTPRA